jgi:hypothetical protein
VYEPTGSAMKFVIAMELNSERHTLSRKSSRNACLLGWEPLGIMAGPTRLELATSGVTGRRSNQLNYDPTLSKAGIITH